MSYSAQIYGTIYKWDDMKEVPALVKIYSNGTLIKQVIADEHGFYNVSLAPGDYLVKFYYVHNRTT
ncbi:MAG: hypothetical protein J7K68_01030, partial [Candidatus Diapherotrites archaeon]|nr:hypothetical protein [Candidatus Diapherotrites archaeon]